MALTEIEIQKKEVNEGSVLRLIACWIFALKKKDTKTKEVLPLWLFDTHSPQPNRLAWGEGFQTRESAFSVCLSTAFSFRN